MYHKKLIFATSCLGLLLFGIGALTLGSLAPELKTKYGMDDLAAGALFSIFPIGILAGSLVFGPVSDRYGYRFVLLGSAMFWLRDLPDWRTPPA
ncbi:MAG: MFS transporter [Haliscomenobacter sp.]|nr:MFS transporter [Haliscomenobacter sp.]